MKKILGIVLAMAMVASVFAAEPVANLSVTEFTGNASVTWGVNLDTNKTGFTNGSDASLKFTVIDGGSKATASDADVWGEIAIKTDGFKYTKNGAIDKDGTASVDYAKLHIGPAYVGILAGDTQVGDIAPVMAVHSDKGVYKIAAVGDNATDGVTLGLDLDGIANFELDIRSAQGYTNEYAMAFQADVKAVENLTLNAGVAMDLSTDTDKDDVAIFGKAAYEMALTDVFYVKPQAGISYDMTKAKAETKIMAALLFGWNKSENQDTNIYFIDPKVSNGASVAALIEGDTVDLTAGIWDSATLVDNLTFGASYANSDLKNKKGTVIAEAKYVVAVGEGKVTPKAGAKIDLDTDTTAIKAGVECAGFVPFTTFSVDYATDDIANKKGTIDLTCKISF